MHNFLQFVCWMKVNAKFQEVNVSVAVGQVYRVSSFNHKNMWDRAVVWEAAAASVTVIGMPQFV